MNTLTSRSFRTRLNVIRHTLLGVGLMSTLSASLYAQNRTDPPGSYILTVERCVKYVEGAQWIYRDYEWSFLLHPHHVRGGHRQKGRPTCGTNSPATIPTAAIGTTHMACAIN